MTKQRYHKSSQRSEPSLILWCKFSGRCLIIISFDSFINYFVSENISALKAQRDTQLLLDLRKQITAEARAGIWTPAQAREKLLQIETAQENPLPLKRQKTVRSPSPDWPSELDSSEEEL